MKPIGPLMIEHRLIDKMIEIIRQKITEIKSTNSVDPIFIDTTVDFIRIYADKTHHGKEEDILFRDCAKKSMSDEDIKLMNELIEEHKFSRKIIGELEEAKVNHLKGVDTLNIIVEKLNTIATFYPKHIEKEDKIFFLHSDGYFTEEEQQEMLKEFREFDQRMIHDKYKLVIENLESMGVGAGHTKK